MLRHKAERKTRSWRYRLCRFLLIVLIVGFLGFVLVNIGLNSPLIRGKIEAKLEEKTGLKSWEIKAVRWTPFSGLSVQKVSSQLVEDDESGKSQVHYAITVDHIKITPYWGKCVTGDFQIKEIEVRDVLCDVQQDWLIDHLVQNDTKPKKAHSKPKPKPSKPPQGSKPAPVPNPDSQPNPNPKPKPDGSVKPKPPAKPAPSVTPKPPQKKQQGEQKPRVPVPPKVGLAKFLTLKNAQVIIRDGEAVIFDSEKVEMLIPFSGEKTQGYIKQAHSDEAYPLQWTGQSLQYENAELDIEGLTVGLKAFISPRKSQPFFIQAIIPEQRYTYHLDRSAFKANLTARSVKGILECRGNLLNPTSWNGGVRVYSESIAMDELMKHQDFAFDTAQINARISGPNLIIDNAEARGHELTLFGNGVAQKNLTGYCVLRVIANPSKLLFLEKVHHGSRVNFALERNTYNMLLPLDNMDYWKADFFLSGKFNNPMLRHERSSTWQPLKNIWGHLMDYKNSELREDGLIP